VNGTDAVENLTFKMRPSVSPKRPRFLEQISEDVPVFLRRIMGTLYDATP